MHSHCVLSWDMHSKMISMPSFLSCSKCDVLLVYIIPEPIRLLCYLQSPMLELAAGGQKSAAWLCCLCLRLEATRFFWPKITETPLMHEVECTHRTIPALLLFKLTFLSCLVFQCSFRFHFAFVYRVLVPTVMQISRGFLTQNEALWKQSMFTLLPYTWIGQYNHRAQKVANEMSDLLLALYYVHCFPKLPVAFKMGKNPHSPTLWIRTKSRVNSRR